MFYPQYNHPNYRDDLFMAEVITVIAAQQELIWTGHKEDSLEYNPDLELQGLPPEARIWVDVLAPETVLQQGILFDKVRETFGDQIKCPGADQGIVLFNDRTTRIAYRDFVSQLGQVPVYECTIGVDYFRSPEMKEKHPEIQTVRQAQGHIIGLLSQWSQEAGIGFKEFKLPSHQPSRN